MMVIAELKNISKQFPGVEALQNVSFCIEKCKILALCGENGAGKSTLGKILAGVFSRQEFTGDIAYNNRIVKDFSVFNAERNGIFMIHQDQMLMKELTVAENMFLGNFPVKHFAVDYKTMYSQTKKYLTEMNMDIDPNAIIKNLSIAEQQMAGIARAVYHKPEIIIFDESTSSLASKEIKTLFDIMRKLKKQGVTIIFITHKLDEIFELCDIVTVLKDGRLVSANVDLSSIKKEDLIFMMINRKLSDMYPAKPAYNVKSKRIFEVKNWTLSDSKFQSKKIVDNFSFELKQNEIVSIYGLMGSCGSELITSIFRGKSKYTDGEIYIHNKKVGIHSPSDSIQNGISFIPADRQALGLFLKQSVNDNLSISTLNQISGRFGIIHSKIELKRNLGIIEKLSIKLSSIKQLTNSLSGGNQQKVMIGKWLLSNPQILILDEPTKGIDIGSRVEIYKILRQLAEKIAVMVISSDLMEVIGISDRVIVMKDGKKVGELIESQICEDTIFNLAIGEQL